MEVSGFSTAGVWLHSTIAGGATYNRFYDVIFLSCPGYGLHADAIGSNATNTMSCRFGACGVGVQIDNTNNFTDVGSQFEANTTAIAITAPALSHSDHSRFISSRFEGNTLDANIGSNVTDTAFVFPALFSTAQMLITDNGVHTKVFSAFGTVTPAVAPQASTVELISQLGNLGIVTEAQSLRLGDSGAAGPIEVQLKAAAGTVREISWLSGGTYRWHLVTTSNTESGGNVGADFAFVCFADDGVTILATTTVTRANGAWNFGGVILPYQAPTASAPPYIRGGAYFDTTLNKLRIGGATAWETVSSA